MKLNLPKRWRVVTYVATLAGTPIVIYARAKGWIGDLELALWGNEVTAAGTLAALNIRSGDQAGSTDGQP